MNNIVVANWKCNPTTEKEAKDIFKKISEGAKGAKKTDVVVCAPFLYLSKLASEKSKAKLGAQDCFYEERGAYTGEISPVMLKEIGCEYVIVGHSERRKYQNETDQAINLKIKAALKNCLKPIFRIDNVDQIKAGTDGLSNDDFKNLTVAYEPIWAIGTGKACGIPESKGINLKIREVLGNSILVLYGGSVSSQNAEAYIKEAGYNGLLVGGASLKPEEFKEIVKAVDSI